ncbi:probable Farnesyl-diphosphate farnesyltransferase [Pseudozyma flocculosa]|uniref:Squalene synthase n=1 Tax=Pseudozyma flocculosa TaxID=84751 RepID=A0A5C3FBS6_9BASI|nr:probable Farnesyl-diphosphate farnesyltransferase [Pseudozyma flocculosa]
MGLLSLLALGVTHPSELRSMIHYKVWRDPLNDIKQNPEASGWNRPQMQECWTFLDQTSRSFAAVIKELKGELSRVICIFYLVLRALDTIEDDMTIPASKKISLLVDFYKVLEQPGWTFTESGPNEKDRHLLVGFDKVIAEYQLLRQGYRTVISDITAKMGAGMASYIEASSSSPLSVDRWQDFDLYCHFVAGLVGEGLSRLWSESGIERPWIGNQLKLSNHMGLFLQKTNIIRDYAEDCDEGRFFWPKACWAASIARFSSQKEVADGIVEVKPGSNQWRPEGEKGDRAMYVLSSMLLDAMKHATSALDYLSLLKEQSVFNFCAIPQVMAIATIELMFQNPNVFKRNVKIRKGQAVQLILKAVNPRDVAYTFRDYSRSIHKRLSAKDPNFVAWSVELGRIEQWCETFFPSFVSAASESREPDARAAAMKKWTEQRKFLATVAQRRVRGGADPKTLNPAKLVHPRDLMSMEEKEAQEKKERDEMVMFFVLVVIGISVVMGGTALIAWMIVWYWTQEGQDPLTANLQYYYYAAKAGGMGALADAFATVREAVSGYLGGSTAAAAGKIEL